MKILFFVFALIINTTAIANTKAFQAERETIVWKVHFKSPPEKVYQALSTDEGRRGYWAETAIEKNGNIHYVFLNGVQSTGKILERVSNKKFSVMYFGWKVTFTLTRTEANGTDMEMKSEGVPEKVKMEIAAGWVSWLMAMKASVDFSIDLRNHDDQRTWFSGYIDN